MAAKKGQSWNEYFEECFEKVLDKLDHMDFNGQVKFNPPYNIGGTNVHVSAELTRKGEDFKLPPPAPKEPKPLRKLTEQDWLNIMQYYKMLFDGEGEKFNSVFEAFQASYNSGIYDEFKIARK